MQILSTTIYQWGIIPLSKQSMSFLKGALFEKSSSKYEVYYVKHYFVNEENCVFIHCFESEKDI